MMTKTIAFLWMISLSMVISGMIGSLNTRINCDDCLNPITKECDTTTPCLVNPCQFNNNCNSNQDCVANYCGGCNAICVPKAAPKKSCTLQCGTEVKHGYRSNGEGTDCCNTCSCNDGALSCTEIACGSQCEPCKPVIPDCVPEGATFVGTPDICMVSRYFCEEGFQSWSNECGCGCKPIKETGQSCELSCGTIVEDGWSGKDEGSNCCNTCFCNNGLLGCTKIGCLNCPNANCGKPECDVNEIFKECVGCDKTCGIDATLCATICKPGCGCKDGFRRDGRCGVGKGKCIPESECRNGCSEGESVYCDCVPCEQKCGEERLCADICEDPNGQCFCKFGFRRNSNNICVPQNECDIGIPKCGKNEVFNPCATCERTCDNPNPLCTRECKPPQCQCDRGYVRDKNGDCIKEDQCPATKCTGKNEEFRTCASCEPTCDNPFIICTLECKPPKCQCKFGFVRDSKGECIKQESCPINCGVNEIFRECSSCEGTCDNPFPICAAVCQKPKCQCQKGFVRRNGMCIPVESCKAKPPQCDTNEIYLECGICDGTCEVSNPPCPRGCKPSGCYCKMGHLRDTKTGKCIPANDCTIPDEMKQCPNNQKWLQCVNIQCPPTCEQPIESCRALCTPNCGCEPPLVKHNDECIKVDECPDICELPRDVGPCRALIPRYYFDGESCVSFSYGGCFGNSNNFETLQECESRCQAPTTTTTTKPVPDICTLDMEVGMCRAAIPRWFYNGGECVQFLYGGCRGNANNFKTLKECEATCESNKPVITSTSTPCKVGQYWNESKNKCSNICKRGFVYDECGPGTCEDICYLDGNLKEDNKHKKKGNCDCVPGCYCPNGSIKLNERCTSRKRCKYIQKRRRQRRLACKCKSISNPRRNNMDYSNNIKCSDYGFQKNECNTDPNCEWICAQ